MRATRAHFATVRARKARPSTNAAASASTLTAADTGGLQDSAAGRLASPEGQVGVSVGGPLFFDPRAAVQPARPNAAVDTRRRRGVVAGHVGRTSAPFPEVAFGRCATRRWAGRTNDRRPQFECRLGRYVSALAGHPLPRPTQASGGLPATQGWSAPASHPLAATESPESRACSTGPQKCLGGGGGFGGTLVLGGVNGGSWFGGQPSGSLGTRRCRNRAAPDRRSACPSGGCRRGVGGSGGGSRPPASTPPVRCGPVTGGQAPCTTRGGAVPSCWWLRLATWRSAFAARAVRCGGLAAPPGVRPAAHAHPPRR